ncbi:hypothetical protein M422DRAFT_192682 [Sphaerobolus stellatus SS14]|uniref:Unplaced genomic scaffold SPHSTscaffold_311, whole genome shotgun sequence n=1 Tax=Sphaerobolus stellatus (strain SS14) TaxID=990650 RepID=A0A0C9UAG7_SPHS4|nr:hypothetical protein M422DRAFT_192682 [Sphaerobolus stellatus SS14]
MEHMFLECQSSGQKVIWQLAKTLWSQTGLPWPDINLGTILGCGLANFKTKKGKPDKAKRRLFKIIVSESAYQIWKIRCEWRIQRQCNPDLKISDHEIRNRWRKLMSSQIHMDILCSDTTQYKKKAFVPSAVQRTWGDLLKTENIRGLCPEDITGFLVGMKEKDWQPP